jgi:hypothetical protein
MKLCNKYNIPQQTVDQMVKDGVISSKWPAYEEVYGMYNLLKASGKSKEQIYNDIADQKNMSARTVRAMVEAVAKI